MGRRETVRMKQTKMAIINYNMIIPFQLLEKAVAATQHTIDTLLIILAKKMKGSNSSKTSSVSTCSSTSTHSEQDNSNHDGNEPTYESDLRRIRNYHVVTTAALPFTTGTAINPLLRAAHLLRRNRELQMERDMIQFLNIDMCHRIASHKDASTLGQGGNCNEMVVGGESSESTAKEESSSTDYPRVGTAANEARNGVKVDLEGQTVDRIDRCPTSPTSSQTTPQSHDDYCFTAATEQLGITSSAAHGSHQPSIPDTIERNIVGERGEPSDSSDCEDSPDCYDQKQHAKAGQVTLVVPWVTDATERQKLYGTATNSLRYDEAPGVTNAMTNMPLFTVQEEQEAYIRSWLAEDACMPEEASELNIMFYPARFHSYKNSIFALGDICEMIPDESADVCILEEPEHLNWYRAPGCNSWRNKFCHCVGIIHTNYEKFMRNHTPAGYSSSSLLSSVNHVVRANCHRVVKLSGGAQQEFALASECCIENVHGVREAYLLEGERRKVAAATSRVVTRGNTKRRWIYFVGQLIWAEGFDQLLDLQSAFRERTGRYFEVNVYGSGPDECEIKRAFSGNDPDSDSGIWGWCSSKNRRRPCLPVNFMGKADHLSLAGDEYSIFVNPSLTEVLCTTTAEAIAMGKWAIIPKHASNAFFEQFPNCLSYLNRREFVKHLQHALINDPPYLSDKHANLLTWEAATTRLLNAAAISKRDALKDELAE